MRQELLKDWNSIALTFAQTFHNVDADVDADGIAISGSKSALKILFGFGLIGSLMSHSTIF